MTMITLIYFFTLQLVCVVRASLSRIPQRGTMRPAWTMAHADVRQATTNSEPIHIEFFLSHPNSDPDVEPPSTTVTVSVFTGLNGNETYSYQIHENSCIDSNGARECNLVSQSIIAVAKF